ncbi:MAG: DUF981 domain-containing protein [Deltaproteobacteria bacterium]|nr:DUF981 domain-containing protein [Deltaproteobacteria bacterium]
MSINYLSLVFLNLAAGLVTLAFWIYLDAGRNTERRWVPGLMMTGLLALMLGLHMVFTWPLPGSANILYGEMSTLFGVLLTGMGIVLMVGMDLLAVGVIAALSGAASLVVAVQMFRLGLAPNPLLHGIAFVWMGILGLGALPMLRLSGSYAFRLFGAVGLMIGALLWAIAAFQGFWQHSRDFQGWVPAAVESSLKPAKVERPAK